MSTKVFLAGHKGLVGSAILRELKKDSSYSLLTRDRKELDLSKRDAVLSFFRQEKPDWVFLAAAKVGGIKANATYPVEFLLDNLKIQNNIIEAAAETGVRKLQFLGSSCIYPKLAPQPLREEYLLTSSLESTNEAYALAKIVGLKLCRYYYQQYGKDFTSIMPCNVYGPNDNYHSENSHVLPALIRKIHEAKEQEAKEFTLWGTGTPRREFIFSEDLAEAAVYLMKHHNAQTIGETINVGTGEDQTILELVDIIKKVIGFHGNIIFDSSKPDGTPRKIMDVSRIHSLGWKAKTPLYIGIEKTYQDFLNNKNLRL